jgi:tetratricopeptide (TPR) repeat protein
VDEDFLRRLAEAKTDDDRSWIVTEMRLEKLHPNLKSMVLAAAIPHWFNVGILKALEPDLENCAEALYDELQGLSFVEPFGELGYHLHDLTRRLIIDRLWLIERTEFRCFSQRIFQYFETQPEKSISQIEQIYHQIISDPIAGSEALNYLVWNWQYTLYRPHLESLLKVVKEQLDNLKWYDFSGEESRDTSEKLSIATTFRAIGDGFDFLGQVQEALNHYGIAVRIYHEIGQNLDEAYTLESIGDIYKLLNQRQEALNYYEDAVRIYHEIGEFSREEYLVRSMDEIVVLLNQALNLVIVRNSSQQVPNTTQSTDLLTNQMNLIDAQSFTGKTTINIKTSSMIPQDPMAQSIDQFINAPLKPRSWGNLLNSVTSNEVFNAGLEEVSVQENSISIPELESFPTQIAEPIATIITKPIGSIIPNPVDPSPNPISQVIENSSPTWSTFESGVYKVDTQGQITIDYLWDGGANEGEVGIFDLSGMEGLLNNPTSFTQEAIRRVVSNSRLGHVVISDSTENEQFSVELISESENYNLGTYLGIRSLSFTMTPGSQFGVVVVQEKFKTTADLSRSGGFFFSLNPSEGKAVFLNEQMILQSDDGSILKIEDTSIQNPISDRDYNDIILQTTGAMNDQVSKISIRYQIHKLIRLPQN